MYFLTVSTLGNVYVSSDGGNNFNTGASIGSSLSGELYHTSITPNPVLSCPFFPLLLLVTSWPSCLYSICYEGQYSHHFLSSHFLFHLPSMRPAATTKLPLLAWTKPDLNWTKVNWTSFIQLNWTAWTAHYRYLNRQHGQRLRSVWHKLNGCDKEHSALEIHYIREHIPYLWVHIPYHPSLFYSIIPCPVLCSCVPSIPSCPVLLCVCPILGDTTSQLCPSITIDPRP